MEEQEALSIEDFASQLSQGDETDQPDNPESEDVTEAQETEETQDETEQDDPDAEQTEEDSSDNFLTYEDDGQEVRVTKEEALEAVKARKSMQADYTKKTQSLAAERQQAHAEFQKQMEFTNAHAQTIGQYQSLAQRAQQLESVDWNTLHQQDPMQFIQLRAELDDSRIALERMGGQLNQQRGAYQQWQQEQVKAKQSEVWEHMKTVKPDFGKPALKAMFEDAEKYGFEFNELNAMQDKRLIHMWADMHAKAKAYDALQTKKPEVTNKVQKLPPKVTKQGTGKAPSRTEQTMQRFQKSGSLSDFASLLSSTRKK